MVGTELRKNKKKDTVLPKKYGKNGQGIMVGGIIVLGIEINPMKNISWIG